MHLNFSNCVKTIIFGSQSDSLRHRTEEFRKVSTISAHVARDSVQKLAYQPTRIRKVFVLESVI